MDLPRSGLKPGLWPWCACLSLSAASWEIAPESLPCRISSLGHFGFSNISPLGARCLSGRGNTLALERKWLAGGRQRGGGGGSGSALLKSLSECLQPPTSQLPHLFPPKVIKTSIKKRDTERKKPHKPVQTVITEASKVGYKLVWHHQGDTVDNLWHPAQSWMPGAKKTLSLVFDSYWSNT